MSKGESESSAGSAADTGEFGPEGDESPDGSRVMDGVRPSRSGAGDIASAEMSGPPEVLIDADGKPFLLLPHLDPSEYREMDGVRGFEGMVLVTPGVFECQRCSETYSVGFSRERAEFGDPPHECESCERQGPFEHVLSDEFGEMDAKGLAKAGRMWEPVTGVLDEGIDQLWDDVRQYLETYWFSDVDYNYDLLTAWVISTWFRPEMEFSAHLSLSGQTMGGKTTLLRTLSRVVYRGHTVAGTTESSMYRLIEDFNTTYLVSEYHGLNSDVRQSIDTVIRAGQKREEYIDRSVERGGRWTVESFNPFSHIAVASMDSLADDIDNRCIKVHTKATPDETEISFDEEPAEAIRNRLAAVRFSVLDSDVWGEAFTDALNYCRERGIQNRTREKVVSLMVPAFLFGRADEMDEAVEQLVSDDIESKQESKDAHVVRAIRAIMMSEYPGDGFIGTREEWADGLDIHNSEADRVFSELTTYETNPQKTASRLRNLGFEMGRDSKGSKIADDGGELIEKMERLCDHYGFDLFTDMSEADVIIELPNDEKGYRKCPLCDDRSEMTHRNIIDNVRMCDECHADAVVTEEP